MTGVFLVLDGPDGAGKTTQLALLNDYFCQRERRVVRCRDPGGTPAGDRVRALLLDPASDLDGRAEALLYFASRAQLVASVVRPALAAGAVVLGDRFGLSTLAYQGYALGHDVEELRRLHRFATGGLEPDWTGVLDLSEEAAAPRLAARAGAADRIEGRGAEYHRKVRAGFLTEAARDPARVSVVDAAGTPEEVHGRVVREVERVCQGREDAGRQGS